MMTKREMINAHWNSFEKYPPAGMNIMLHMEAHKQHSNTVLHGFTQIHNFNPVNFCPKDYIKADIKGVVWGVSWLPLSSLQKNV